MPQTGSTTVAFLAGGAVGAMATLLCLARMRRGRYAGQKKRLVRNHNMAQPAPTSSNPDRARMDQILAFMRETDKLKLVDRTVYVTGGKKKENSAEHSWHLALLYMALQEDLPLCDSSETAEDRLRMLEMLLIHDLVEVYVGDTPLLENVIVRPDGDMMEDDQKWAPKQREEHAAAEKLFALLPDDLATHFRELYDEFEQWSSPVAKVAKGLDKLHCLVQNSCCNGMDYKAYNSTYAGEVSLIDKYVEFDPTLKVLAEIILQHAKEQGWLG